jgi:tetratricopeptide (TPR) repeat protein
MKRMLGLVFLVMATACASVAQGPPQTPLTEKEVVDLLKSKQPPAQTTAIIRQRGVAFELTPEIEKKLRKAKADDQFIEVVKNEGPAARTARFTAAGTIQAPPEESQSFAVIRDELDPDRTLQLVKEFETKYPNSSLLTLAYTSAAYACRQKAAAASNAAERKSAIDSVLEYGEKSLKLKPDNLLSLLIMAAMLPQSQLGRGADLDKGPKLAQAEGYAQQAIQLIDQLAVQPGQSNEQFQRAKAEVAWEPHSALGMIHLERSLMALQPPDKEELAKAEQEYQMAVSLANRPLPQDYFRLGEVRAMLNKVDEAIEAFTKAGELGQGTLIKTYADQKVQELSKRKAQMQPPAKQ